MIFMRLVAHMSGVMAKLGYVIAMLWLYATRPAVLAASLMLLSLFTLLAVTSRTR